MDQSLQELRNTVSVVSDMLSVHSHLQCVAKHCALRGTQLLNLHSQHTEQVKVLRDEQVMMQAEAYGVQLLLCAALTFGGASDLIRRRITHLEARLTAFRSEA